MLSCPPTQDGQHNNHDLNQSGLFEFRGTNDNVLICGCPPLARAKIVPLPPTLLRNADPELDFEPKVFNHFTRHGRLSFYGDGNQTRQTTRAGGLTFELVERAGQMLDPSLSGAWWEQPNPYCVAARQENPRLRPAITISGRACRVRKAGLHGVPA